MVSFFLSLILSGHNGRYRVNVQPYHRSVFVVLISARVSNDRTNSQQFPLFFIAFIVLVGGLLCRYVNSGWIHIFLLSGILGFLWLPLWIWQAADTPADHRSISSAERDYIQNIIGQGVQNKHRRPISLTALPWKDILRSKPVIALFVTELCCLFGLFFFLSNFGKLLTEIQHIPSQYTGYILACGFICMLISTVLSGKTIPLAKWMIDP